MKHELIGRKARIKDSGTVRQWTIVGVHKDHDNLVWVADSEGRIGGQSYVRLDQLELIEPKVDTCPKGYIGVGDFRCTQDEATEWFVFVMLQAAQMFTGIPDDSRAEVLRLLKVRGLHEDSPDVVAAMAYYDAAAKWYQENSDDEG